MINVRKAQSENAIACVVIVNNWISKTKEMPKLFNKIELEQMIKEAIPLRVVWLVCNPAKGYISLNRQTLQIMGLYTLEPGNGLGKILLDKVKLNRSYLHLWSHSFNKKAHNFYQREGFSVIGKKEKGDDGLPEIHFEWKRNRCDWRLL